MTDFLADGPDWHLKVLKKTPLEYPRYLAALCCGSAFPEKGLAFHQDFGMVGRTLVDWQRGIVHCVLIQHLENLSNRS